MGRAAPRIKKRLTCELQVRESRYSGIVLDVSESGLFVQTTAKLRPRTTLDLRITGGTAKSQIALRAVVARRFESDPRLATIRPPGVGVAILEAPKAYYAELLGTGVPRRVRPPAAAAAPSRPEPAGGLCFEVRVAQVSGTRSRVLKLEAADAEGAGKAALAKAGNGWEVREVTPA